MSVKVENRPENRFQCYIDFERTEIQLLKVLTVDTVFNEFNLEYGAHLKHVIYDNLIKVRTHLLTANGLNVYDELQYPKRVDNFEKTIYCLSYIKNVLEMYFKLSKNASISKYSEVIVNLENVKNKVSALIKSDANRHKKGQKLVKQEYFNAKKHNFFKSITVDHSKQDPSIMKHKDPFDIKKLTITDVNDVTYTEGELEDIYKEFKDNQ